MDSTLLGPYFPPLGAPVSLGPPMTANTRCGPPATPATPGAPRRMVSLRPSRKTRVTSPDAPSATTSPRWFTAFLRPNGTSRPWVTTPKPALPAASAPAASDADCTPVTAPAAPIATADATATLLCTCMRTLPFRPCRLGSPSARAAEPATDPRCAEVRGRRFLSADRPGQRRVAGIVDEPVTDCCGWPSRPSTPSRKHVTVP